MLYLPYLTGLRAPSRLREHQPNSLNYFPLVFRSPETRGNNCPPPPRSQKFRLRRAKIIIIRVLIYPTARRRRKIFEVLRLQKRVFLCQNCIYVIENTMVFNENPWKAPKISSGGGGPQLFPPLVLRSPETRGIIQGIWLITLKSANLN